MSSRMKYPKLYTTFSEIFLINTIITQKRHTIINLVYSKLESLIDSIKHKSPKLEMKCKLKLVTICTVYHLSITINTEISILIRLITFIFTFILFFVFSLFLSICIYLCLFYFSFYFPPSISSNT